jgi:hypothetical protein
MTMPKKKDLKEAVELAHAVMTVSEFYVSAEERQGIQTLVNLADAVLSASSVWPEKKEILIYGSQLREGVEYNQALDAALIAHVGIAGEKDREIAHLRAYIDNLIHELSLKQSPLEARKVSDK